MLRLSLLLLHILFPLIVAGQQLTVVELNCENLFDYRHDEGKNDEDYLPESIVRIFSIIVMMKGRTMKTIYQSPRAIGHVNVIGVSKIILPRRCFHVRMMVSQT